MAAEKEEPHDATMGSLKLFNTLTKEAKAPILKCQALMLVSVCINSKGLLVLVDTKATYNFVSTAVVTHVRLKMVKDGFAIFVEK